MFNHLFERLWMPDFQLIMYMYEYFSQNKQVSETILKSIIWKQR